MLLQRAGAVEAEEGKNPPHPTLPWTGATQGDRKGKEGIRSRERGKEEAGCFLQHPYACMPYPYLTPQTPPTSFPWSSVKLYE